MLLRNINHNCYYEKIGTNKPVKLDDLSFDIPESWAWIRLGSILEIARGGSPRPIKDYLTEDNNGINWIKIGDTEKGGKYINSTKEKIIKAGISKSRFVHKGDFLLTNSMSFGRPYILNVDGCIHDGWLVLSDKNNIYNKDFLYYILSSHYACVQFIGKVSGAVVKNLNSDKVSDSIFPLPPIQEQERIVKKLIEIEPLLYQYDIIEKKLSKLECELTEKLKKSVLQYAIEGKLVKQNPEDEPSSILLERIKQEKDRLIKEGKIKRDKNESFVCQTDDKNYYMNLPINWALTRLSNICKVITCGYASTPKYVENGIPFISAKNIKPYKFIYKNYNYISEELYKKIHSNYHPEKGDILLTRVGAGIGEACIIDNEEKFGLYVSVTLIKLINNNINEYILHLLQSPYGSTLSKENTYGKDSSQGNLNVNNVRNFIIALPPLKEIDRINLKIKEIYNLIND